MITDDATIDNLLLSVRAERRLTDAGLPRNGDEQVEPKVSGLRHRGDDAVAPHRHPDGRDGMFGTDQFTERVVSTASAKR